MRVVVALGGNALTPKSGKGTFSELERNIARGIKPVVFLAKQGRSVVLVSGSGPQIGALILQNQLAGKRVPEMPLDVLDAELEGELGYMLEQSLQNAFAGQRIKKSVVSVVTQVLVDGKDKGFRNPSKPVGKYLSKKEVNALKRAGIAVGFERGKGYRKLVASPFPKKIVEEKAIRNMLKKNAVVIAAVGGGIPVVKQSGKLKGVEGVIDKDLAASLVGRTVKADLLLILTNVDCIYKNFATKKQSPLKKLLVKQAKELLRKGEFGSGTMKPKVLAAIDFLENGGKKAIVTSTEKALLALKGKAGTVIA